ncbi:unnamed protein product [Trichogramma brassicae]|uniref:Uncharacterized protein n=1 Tax=Trichogramma brassicae TaxID=86971 RepID=A0A6H5IGJ0_9HYME|nr:unnamed protein product [Trichogramma brassicae]
MSLLLAVIERLGKRGYELYQNDALAIMKLFTDNGLFKKSTGSNELCWYNDEEFATEVKKIPMVSSSLTLYDVFQLQTREAAKVLSYSDYMRFESLHQSLILSKGIRDACALRLCEIMARKFFQQWASDPFYKIIHGRLPIECCDMITEGLLNEDLYNICLASTRLNS